ncbi:MAG TPA: POTRA domain-containing protein, partial [Thermosynechococcaceae cyanobacterium]
MALIQFFIAAIPSSRFLGGRLSVVLLVGIGTIGLGLEQSIAEPSPVSPAGVTRPSGSSRVAIEPGQRIAQTPLPPPQDVLPPRPTPPPVQPPLPPPDVLLPSPTPGTPSEPEAPETAPQRLTVDRFNVTGSTVFSAADLAKVTAPYTKRPISLAELFQARSAVTQLYVDRGYITSGAYIPPQKLQDGVVEIRVVEGELEDIRITGTRRLNPNYVRSRLALGAQKPLNRVRLLEALQLLQINPLISTVSAELSTGSRPGTSLLEVRVAEAKTFDAQIAFDNSRSPSVGTFRRQVQLSEGNLLGLGDGLSIGYTNTDGSNEGNLNY